MPKAKKFDIDEKTMHDGHRKRLTATVHKVGLDGLSDVQALEYILFYIFPRGDVNPLAHRLLSRFNNVPTVLEASVEDLMQVKGMGESSAQKLQSLLEIFYYYTQVKVCDGDNMKTMGDFYDYLEQLLRYRDEEELFIFGVDNMGEIVKGRRFTRGNAMTVELDMKEIALYISTHKVQAVFVVHNHPTGSAKESGMDRETFEKLKLAFKFQGCSLIDSIIVGKDGIYSMASKGFVRLFSQGVEYLQALLQVSQQSKN